jgi:hypothetical protein
MDVSDLLAITLKKKIENKGSQMGHTKKKKILVLGNGQMVSIVEQSKLLK